MNRISPEVGSVSRLMQRMSVDLPVPEGPMIAVMPLSAKVSEMLLRTGTPARYSFVRFFRTSMRPLAAFSFGMTGDATFMNAIRYSAGLASAWAFFFFALASSRAFCAS
jgi:hypothetical protein